MRKSFEVLNIKCGGCAGTVKSKLKDKFPDITQDELDAFLAWRLEQK